MLSDAVRTKLTDADRNDLLVLSKHPGYVTLLRLMEMECVLQDNALLKCDAADVRAVLAEHRKSQAMWAFFSNVKRQIEFEASELLAANEAASALGNVASILDTQE